MFLIKTCIRWWRLWRTTTITITYLWYRHALVLVLVKFKLSKVWAQEEEEEEEGPTQEPKNYYWTTEEKHGVRHNTLKYNRRPQPQHSQTSQPSQDQPPPGEIWQKNCCTFLLIFIIFVLAVLLMLAVLRCYQLEHSSPLKKINNKSAVYSRNTVLPTERSFTFFPFWYYDYSIMIKFIYWF